MEPVARDDLQEGGVKVLAAGVRLGRYEIVAPLGAGGMGEVWRARDSRLARDVAIKVLPRRLTADSAALQRFEREARAVAALSHPNILAIHDFERDGETRFAVTELLEGESLRVRVRAGPVPPRKVREWGAQVARALAAAHDRGLVHRDVKPENLFLTSAGAVKLLDFGLARQQAGPQVETAVGGESSLTTAGMLVGTVGYMAPEQLRGEAVDARADVFALGCVLYELLTGERAFAAGSSAEVMSAILEHDPPRLETLAESASPELARIVRRCLDKRREHRFQSAHDLAFALEGSDASTRVPMAPPVTEPVAAPGATLRRARPAWLAWSAAAVLVVATAIAAWLAFSRGAPRTGSPLRFSIAPPAGLRLADPWMGVELSPDGRSIAVIASRATEPPQLWVRPLDGLEPRRLAGTDGASLPFWSPDGRALGFFAGGKLMRVEADGSGPPTILGEAPEGYGGAWNQQGDILFAPDRSGPLYRVPAAGGQPVQATRLAAGEMTHRLPTFLPDGRRFLFLRVGSVITPSGQLETVVAALDDPRPRSLLWASSVARVVPGGDYVVFAREQSVLAQRLDGDSARLVGDAQTVGRLSAVMPYIAGGPIISAAGPELLVFGSEPRRSSRLQWLAGAALGERAIDLAPGHALQSVSPDGRYAVLELQSSTRESDLWVVELESGVPTRLTHEPGVERWATWSPDSRRVAYTVYPEGTGAELHVREVRHPERDELLWRAADFNVGGTHWSRDGRLLAFHQKTAGRSSRFDVWYLPLVGARRPLPYLQGPFDELFPVLSPDGGLLAYLSDQSGSFELYVQSFPDGEERVGFPKGASTSATWSADGRQLIYGGSEDDVMAVDVERQPELRVSSPRTLVDLPAGALAWTRADDGRLLVQLADSAAAPASVTVVVNWTALLER